MSIQLMVMMHWEHVGQVAKLYLSNAVQVDSPSWWVCQVLGARAFARMICPTYSQRVDSPIKGLKIDRLEYL